MQSLFADFETNAERDPFASRSSRLQFTIRGEPASKANSRQLVFAAGDTKKLRSVKSEKALQFERAALRQIPTACRLMLTCVCAVRIRIFYASERPDLDASLVLDCLQARYERKTRKNGSKAKVLIQKGVVVNDRQFRRIHLYHDIDKENPRCEITVWPIEKQKDLPYGT